MTVGWICYYVGLIVFIIRMQLLHRATQREIKRLGALDRADLDACKSLEELYACEPARRLKALNITGWKWTLSLLDLTKWTQSAWYPDNTEKTLP